MMQYLDAACKSLDVLIDCILIPCLSPRRASYNLKAERMHIEYSSHNLSNLVFDLDSLSISFFLSHVRANQLYRKKQRLKT